MIMKQNDFQSLIRECVLEVMEEKRKKPPSKTHGKVTVKDVIPSYGELQRKRNQQFRSLMRASGESDTGMDYVDIGFGYTDYYIWFWDEPYKKLMVVKGVGMKGHNEYFGNPAYHNFRGRYDVKTKDLSIVAPEHIQNPRLKRDIIPDELITALEKEFPGHKLHFFNTQQ
jgi:hypothetical protein